MKELNQKQCLLSLISITKNSWQPYICNNASTMLRDGEIDLETFKWIAGQMKPSEVPKELRGVNWLGKTNEGLWTWKEREMRIKYLQYLIEQL